LKSTHQKENLEQLLSYIPWDFVIREGLDDENLYRIVAVREASQVDEYMNAKTIGISDVVAGRALTHRLPIVDVTSNPEKLADLLRSCGGEAKLNSPEKWQ
jgi:molybdopterin-guanine dinucleotide biosynthesis protein